MFGLGCSFFVVFNRLSQSTLPAVWQSLMGMLCRVSHDQVCGRAGEAQQHWCCFAAGEAVGRAVQCLCPNHRKSNYCMAIPSRVGSSREVAQKQQGKSSLVENALGSLILPWMGRGYGRWIPFQPIFTKYFKTERSLTGFGTDDLRLRNQIFSPLGSLLLNAGL